MSLVERLAELVGFYSSYTGTFGEKVFAKDQAREALLSSMGYQLDEKSLTESINHLENYQWQNMLPSTHIVMLEEEHHFIKISIPENTDKNLHWKVITELSEEISGCITINELTFVDCLELKNYRYCQYSFPLPQLKAGYHELSITYNNKTETCPLIYAPKACYSPKDAGAEKVWGFTAQLYSLKSNHNWGIGDFSDLRYLIKKSANQGAATIGINPLHPLYQNNPAHRSPYSPSSRCFLNPLYISITDIPQFSQCQKVQDLVNSIDFKEKLLLAKNAEHVNYPAVAELKYEALALLFEYFCNIATPPNSAELESFIQFKQTHGDDLLQFATFEALYEYFRSLDEHAYGWTHWPEAYQKQNSAEIIAFREAHKQRIEYFCFVQWLAHCQLSAVKEAAQAQNMEIGLYLDLAVGCDGSGLDVWSNQVLYVAGASIGAPPDAMNALGQNWGLTPMNPVALKEQGYQPLVKALRSNMQYSGALRIDHILGLMRQYWVAPNMAADEGVYISFPFDEILRIIALESQRNKCIVIGEDLGNVPNGFSEIMHSAGLLSFKVMFFERWESGLFKRPELFPEQSVVTIATHDTATLTGWWKGRDLQWRETLNLYPSEEAGEHDRHARAGERAMLIDALNDMQVIDLKNAPLQSPATMNTELSIAVQKYLAAAKSHIQLIPLEDAIECEEQVNIPGTIDQHPNWLQKLPVSIEDFFQTNSVNEIVKAMRQARPK
jgi:4-alpha-glucanotransferase